MHACKKKGSSCRYCGEEAKRSQLPIPDIPAAVAAKATPVTTAKTAIAVAAAAAGVAAAGAAATGATAAGAAAVGSTAAVAAAAVASAAGYARMPRVSPFAPGCTVFKRRR